MSKMKLVDSLAVKYRPNQFSEVLGNEKNVSIITGYFIKRQLVKSWLLSGAPGSGKTTTARIMAMAVNCENLADGSAEPCLKCTSCKMAIAGTHPDIKEINAGSEEGRIAGIEEIMSTLKFRPRFSAKVIIVDETHLLSGKAKESILKPLEEPPAGVMWILATTDPNKLPQAVFGRCAKLFFDYPRPKETAQRLLKIAKKEFPLPIVKRMKPFLIPIAESTYSQIRNSLSMVESLGNMLIANPKVDDAKLQASFKDILMDVGDLDTYAIRYVTYLMNRSYGLPLSICAEIEPSRVGEFVTLVSRYAQYAATYYTYATTKSLGLKAFYAVRRKFYGVPFQRFDSALEKLKTKLEDQGVEPKELIARGLGIAAGLIAGLERLRGGVIQPEQALIYAINHFVSGQKTE